MPALPRQSLGNARYTGTTEWVEWLAVPGFRAGDRGGTIVVVIPDSLAPRLAQTRDVAALVGLVATLESELMLVPETDALPDWAAPLAHRLGRDGLLDEDAGQHELRQALNDLNHRLRYVLGEYDEPIAPLPVP